MAAPPRSADATSGELLAGKNRKYVSGNPLARLLIDRFVAAVEGLLSTVSFRAALEIGCGEGILLQKLRGALGGGPVAALDIDAGELRAARVNAPFAGLARASAYAVPFGDEAFDLVLCSEVLEHLEDPERALEEVHRAGARHFLFSVPAEPAWRVLNLCRGAYLRTLGNPPGHVNHWSPREIVDLLGRTFEVVAVRRPLPWTVVLCRKAERAGGPAGGR